MRKPPSAWHIRRDDSPGSSSTDASFMTLLSTAQHLARDTRRDPRSHMMLIMVAVTITAGAIALVAYLLWPTWVARPASAPDRLPVSVGATLFNVPTAAIRRKIQRHSGPQERVDLEFRLPVAGTAGCAEARQRRYDRRKGTADRPHLRVDIGPSRRAGTRRAGPHHLSALSRRRPQRWCKTD